MIEGYLLIGFLCGLVTLWRDRKRAKPVFSDFERSARFVFVFAFLWPLFMILAVAMAIEHILYMHF